MHLLTDFLCFINHRENSPGENKVCKTFKYIFFLFFIAINLGGHFYDSKRNPWTSVTLTFSMRPKLLSFFASEKSHHPYWLLSWLSYRNHCYCRSLNQTYYPYFLPLLVGVRIHQLQSLQRSKTAPKILHPVDEAQQQQVVRF